MGRLRDHIVRAAASVDGADRARVHAILEALTAHRGLLRNADAVARESGFASRHQLHRFLKSRGLPSVRRLSGWIRVALLASSGDPVEELAWSDGVDPAVDHRRFRRLTGMTCQTARASDVAALVGRLATQETGTGRGHHSRG